MAGADAAAWIALAARGVRRLDAMRVVSLRHLELVVDEAVPFVHAAPAPGRDVVQPDGRWCWRSPTEWWWIGSDASMADELLRRCAPGLNPNGLTIDLTEGLLVLVLELDAAVGDQVLAAGLCPDTRIACGHSAFARLAEIGALVVRPSAAATWLLTDRATAHYLSSWLQAVLQP